MNNYLLQILKETKTIIIPGLGALTVTNEATGEMMFMSFLKHDDGNLAKYISEKEGMDINDAKNLIAKYVREIQAEVDKGDKYSMYQFGNFSKVDGEIVFEQWAAGSETAPVEENTSVTEEPKAEEKSEPVIEEKVEHEIPVVETPVAPKVEDLVHEEPTVEAEEAVTTIETPATEPEPIIEQQSKTELEIVSSVTAETPSDSALEENNPENEKIGKSESNPRTELEIASIVAAETTPTIESAANAVKEESKTQDTIPVEKVPQETPVMETKVVVTEVPPIAEKSKSAVTDVKKPAGKSPKEQLKAADTSAALKTPKKKKTGVFAYILWGFVVLILGSGTYVAVQFDTLKKDFPILAKLTGEKIEENKDTLATLGEEDPIANPDSMPEAEELPADDGTKVEPIEAEEPVVEAPAPKKAEPVKKPTPTPKPAPKPKPTPKPTPKPAPVVKPVAKPTPVSKPVTAYKPRPKPANFPAPNLSKPFHIIAGSFSSRTNALNFATKLKNRGLSNLSVGEKGGLYKVSINGYSTEDEAKAALPSVAGIAPGAWVFNWN